MKKCHFTIFYNELPFLKQKMEFLYRNFDQLIFYDLNVTYKDKPFFSTDGSHEYVKNYPDPENKITLIEKTNLSDVSKYNGIGNIDKCKMFAVGSFYVREDIESFWCFDLDEFYNETLLQKTDLVFLENKNVNNINIDHLVFYKNEKTLVSETLNPWKFPYSRIARHKPGNIYGHCSLDQQYPKTYNLKEELCYHFGWVGNERVKRKVDYYNKISNKNFSIWFDTIWKKYDEHKINIKEGSLYLKNAHPNGNCGLHLYNGNFPEYIDISLMMEELGCD